ncbi:hypothetical protein PCC7418_3604 [Halothece sp. PCC 7418]|nr:hypothetical protein PCC7418_3604 [Halothece sp. PCC 7418]
MQKQRLSMRVEVSRIEKLRLYARYKRKTMTQLVEDWIDTRFASTIKRGHRELKLQCVIHEGLCAEVSSAP